jgi:hypothetical protein
VYPAWTRIQIDGDDVLREYTRYETIEGLLRKYGEIWDPARREEYDESWRGEQFDHPTRTERFLTRIKNHPVVSVLIVGAAIIAGIATFTGKISDAAESLAKLFGQSTPSVVDLDELLETLSIPQSKLAQRNLAIDRIVKIARKQKGERAVIAARLADFIRDEIGYSAELKDSCNVFPEAMQGTVRDDVEYALQVLGEDPLQGGWVQPGSARLELRRILGPQIHLQRKRYHRVDFADAIFFKANLIETQFINCDLSGVVFSESKMDSAKFDYSSLRKACFAHAILPDASFRQARLAESSFEGAVLTGADLTGAIEYEQVLSWRGADLVGTKADPKLIEWAVAHGARGKAMD